MTIRWPFMMKSTYETEMMQIQTGYYKMQNEVGALHQAVTRLMNRLLRMNVRETWPGPRVRVRVDFSVARLLRATTPDTRQMIIGVLANNVQNALRDEINNVIRDIEAHVTKENVTVDETVPSSPGYMSIDNITGDVNGDGEKE